MNGKSLYFMVGQWIVRKRILAFICHANSPVQRKTYFKLAVGHGKGPAIGRFDRKSVQYKLDSAADIMQRKSAFLE